MIINFEKITKPLNDKEVEFAELLTSVFNDSVKYYKNKDIVYLAAGMGLRLTPARVRQVIHYIRINHLVNGLVATADGYKRATSDAELQRYVKSLRQRRNSIDDIIRSFEI